MSHQNKAWVCEGARREETAIACIAEIYIHLWPSTQLLIIGLVIQSNMEYWINDLWPDFQSV